jgi:hypothetical protein
MHAAVYFLCVEPIKSQLDLLYCIDRNFEMDWRHMLQASDGIALWNYLIGS